MEVKRTLALPDGLKLTGIEVIGGMLIITALSTQNTPCCPLCGTPATRVHSRYTRQIADLPCGGQHVRLLVLVRKCFCKAIGCQRKIFAERLTPFVVPHEEMVGILATSQQLMSSRSDRCGGQEQSGKFPEC
ncbi:MAG TPA: transposase family protein [Ktedonobacteraceae bacterium]|jgi:transposase